VKHSDPRFTPAIPLSSTVASHSSRGKTMLQRTNRFSSRERKSLMKSPGTSLQFECLLVTYDKNRWKYFEFLLAFYN